MTPTTWFACTQASRNGSAARTRSTEATSGVTALARRSCPGSKATASSCFQQARCCRRATHTPATAKRARQRGASARLDPFDRPEAAFADRPPGGQAQRVLDGQQLPSWRREPIGSLRRPDSFRLVTNHWRPVARNASISRAGWTHADHEYHRRDRRRADAEASCWHVTVLGRRVAARYQLARLEASFPLAAPASIAGRAVVGRALFGWGLSGQFLTQYEEFPDPDVPDSSAIIGFDPDSQAYTQHYFDSRGVARVYAMTLSEGVWTLLRERPDFTPLDFSQRFTGTGSDASSWKHDFDLTYTKAS